VSLDPARDNTSQLRQLAERHGITDPRWHIVRTEANTVREMAALLGIRYRQLPNGDISHSPTIVLLDQGRRGHRTNGKCSGRSCRAQRSHDEADAFTRAVSVPPLGLLRMHACPTVGKNCVPTRAEVSRGLTSLR
jgi:hypothetical protein